jgi:predicted transposase YdaD
MTVAEFKRVLDTLPDDMFVFMYVDEENCLEVCDTDSNIEEVMSELDQSIRVFMLRPAQSEGLIIPKTMSNN